MENMLQANHHQTPQIGEPGKFNPNYRCLNPLPQELSLLDRTLVQPYPVLVRFVVSLPELEDAYTVEAIGFWSD